MTTAAVQASTPAAPPRAELASSNPPTLVPGSAAFQRPLPAAIFGTSELFPAVLQPSSPITFEQTLDQLRSAAASGQIKALLKQHGGALLLRSFPIFTPDDFSEIAFACEVGTPHEEIGRPPKRTQFAPAVSSANEGPPEAELFMHSEYGWAIHHPAYLLFFSLVPAAEGGETPLASGLELYARLEKEDPDFVAQLAEKGLKYHYRYDAKDVLTSNSGASVKSAYGKDVLEGDSPEVFKQKIESQIRRHSQNFEWHEDGSLSVYHHVPYIRIHHATGLKTCFGNLLSAYGRSKFYKALEPPFLGSDGGYHPLPLYGDGSAINVESLERAEKIVEETRVLLKWQQGDVVLFDNHSIMHGRIPWRGERRVLASLWDGEEFPEEA